MNNFKIRASRAHDIMAGDIGLSPTQQEKYNDLLARKNGKHPKGLALTAKMEQELAKIQYMIENPELPQGAKTYCKKWLNETVFGRRPIIKSKYIDKGNATEEDGFTLMCLQMNLGMVYKNSERRSNDFLVGECDLDHEKTNAVYDNKSSYELDTFPLWETKIPSPEYETQIRCYMELWDRPSGVVVYTLNDLPLDMLARELRYIDDHDERATKAKNYIFTRKAWEEARNALFDSAEEIDFIEITDKDRVKPFYFERNATFAIKLQQRVEMCRKYINELLTTRQHK